MSKRLEAKEIEFFEKLYLDRSRAMYGYAYSMLKDHYAAEDMVQDAFLKLLRHYDTLSALPRPKLYSYINKTVHSVTCNYIKKQSRMALSLYGADCPRGYWPDLDVLAMSPLEAAWPELSPMIAKLPPAAGMLLYEKYALCLPLDCWPKGVGFYPQKYVSRWRERANGCVFIWSATAITCTLHTARINLLPKEPGQALFAAGHISAPTPTTRGPARRKSHWIGFDAGATLERQALDGAREALFRLIL